MVTHATNDDLIKDTPMVPEDYDLNPKDKCLRMMEIDGYDDVTGHEYRWQYTWIVRNDQVYAHRRRIGLSIFYPAPPISIPNCWMSDGGRVEMFHTIGELQYMMENNRAYPDTYWDNIQPTDYHQLLGRRAEAERELARGVIGISTPTTRRFLK